MSSDAPAQDSGGNAQASPHTLVPDEASAREAQARRARQRLLLALAVLASALVLTVIGTWTYNAVERSLRTLRANALRAVLDAQTRTLELWIESQKLEIERLARDRSVRAHVRALVAIAAQAGARPEQYCAAPARRPLVDQLTDALDGTGAVVFNVVEHSGRVVASKFPPYCGLRMRPAMLERALEPVFRGETRFVRPYDEADRVEAPPGGGLPISRPLVWIETPVRNDAGRIIAALGVGRYAHEQFAAILAAARIGETGEGYAFDPEGTMLSESRFARELAGASREFGGAARGAASAAPRTMLKLALQPPDAAAFTALVAAAHRGAARGAHEGVLLEPYAGYRGVPVVGAWRWLPAHHMGIAVEMSADEAYAPLGVLRTVFAVVFGALVVAVFVALAAWFSVARMQSRIRERRLGAYVLGERIGEGGVAHIHLARHDLLKRPVAVKLLKSSRATDEIIARFEREAQLASQLSHPNTVEVYDYGRAPGGLFYYVMEYLDGATIGDLVLRGGAMPVARGIHLLRQVCAALAEAHGRGLVHRDISPTNIMVCRYGGEHDFVKILDFGLVKNLAEPQVEVITRTVRVIGTLLYLSPERLRDPADVDARADIYAVGAVAFFMLTGKRMFETLDELALTTCVLNDVPPRLSQAAAQPVPPALDDLVAACLEKQREHRPQNISEFRDVLDALAPEARWTQREAAAAWAALRPADPPSPQ